VMMTFDHVGLAARDAHGSAEWLARVFGIGEPTVDGAGGAMFRVALAPPRSNAKRCGELIDDPLGGGRAYFVDANGYLFEITC
jgi:hypothetical protein